MIKKCLHYNVCWFVERYSKCDVECSNYIDKDNFYNSDKYLGKYVYKLSENSMDVIEYKVYSVEKTLSNEICCKISNSSFGRNGYYRTNFYEKDLDNSVFLTLERVLEHRKSCIDSIIEKYGSIGNYNKELMEKHHKEHEAWVWNGAFEQNPIKLKELTQDYVFIRYLED